VTQRRTEQRRVPASALPGWLRPLALAAREITADQLMTFRPPPEGGRAGSVLALFGETDGRADVLVIERAHDMRSHAGQPAFPGGAVDPTDDGPVTAALREAAEETGLDPAGVDVFATLPELYLPPSGFVVTPVLAWWRAPSPVDVVDPAEVASVHRIHVAELVDPANRCSVRHPSGFRGPGFLVRGLLVWGFTAGLLSRLLQAGGLDVPWDADRLVDLPERQLRQALRSEAHPGFVADAPTAAAGGTA
jgi:8-oxo-dGTP pyrophosphatase MutT (NUDIX family)